MNVVVASWDVAGLTIEGRAKRRICDVGHRAAVSVHRVAISVTVCAAA